MTEFDDDFAANAAPIMLGPPGDPEDITAWKEDLGEFGELLSYRPLNGIPRPFKGMVNRGQRQTLGEVSEDVKFEIEAYDNDPISGLEGSTVTRGDQIDVADVKGQTPRTRTVSRVLDSTGGMIVVEVL